MIWLQPAAWLGLAALAAPVLIHLLVRRHSVRLAFPTLRFLQPTRLASLRRHRLDDLALMLVRAAIVAAAVAALAGPLVVTRARQASWNRRVARAIVVDVAEPGRSERTAVARREAAAAYRSAIIEAVDPAEGLRRATAWLAVAPPSRREIVAVAPFAIGAVTDADVDAVPREIGMRFVRSGPLPPTRTVPGTPLLEWTGTGAGAHGRPGQSGGGPGADRRARPEMRAGIPSLVARHRTVTLTGGQTLVVDAEATSPTILPIDIVAPAEDAAIVDAALAAVIDQGAPAPAARRTARLVIAGAPEAASMLASVQSIQTPWIGDAVARIMTDPDVVRAARAVVAGGTAAAPRGAPWQIIAGDANGASIVSAAQAGDRLIVASGAPSSDLLTPVLIRSMLDVLASSSDGRNAEIVPIAEAQLRAWERSAGPAPMPQHLPHGESDDDRRWLWAIVLVLMLLEGWMRDRGPRRVESEWTDVENRVA